MGNYSCCHILEGIKMQLVSINSNCIWRYHQRRGSDELILKCQRCHRLYRYSLENLLRELEVDAIRDEIFQCYIASEDLIYIFMQLFR